MVTSNELPAKQSRRPNTETWSCQAVEHWRTLHSSRPKWIIQTLLKFTSRTKITVQWWQNAEGNCSKWNSPAHSTCSFRSESARRLWMRYLCPSRQAMATFRVLNKLLPSRPRNGMSSIGEADEFVFFFSYRLLDQLKCKYEQERQNMATTIDCLRDQLEGVKLESQLWRNKFTAAHVSNEKADRNSK